MRFSSFCMLFPGVVGILGDAGTDRMFSLRTCRWNHVAGDNQPFFPKVSYRRNRDVCISGIGRRSWCNSRPHSRRESCRSCRRKLEKRTVGSNDFSCLHDTGTRLPLSILPEEELTGIASNSSKKRFFCTLCKKREGDIRIPCAVKVQSGITGRVLRSLLFRFSFDSSRNRMWGRKCPGKTNWICFSSVV